MIMLDNHMMVYSKINALIRLICLQVKSKSL